MRKVKNVIKIRQIMQDMTKSGHDKSTGQENAGFTRFNTKMEKYDKKKTQQN